MYEWLRTLCYAARNLARTPAFAATVVLTLVLAIAANATVFSIVDRVLFTSLPYPQEDRLAYVTHTNETSELRLDVPPIRLLDWAERNSSFEAIATYYTEDVTDTTGDRPENLIRATATRGFFDVWGIELLLGRNFTAEEHLLGGPQSVIVSERYWRERLNSRSDVVGSRLIIQGGSIPVIGVLPDAFEFVDSNVDIWMPIEEDAPWTASRAGGWFSGVVGRLAPGVTLGQAEADLGAIQTQLAAEYPETDSDLSIAAIAYRDLVVAPFRGSLALLYGAVTLLLLIACANITALLLARAEQRRHDRSIRYALGASRLRIAEYAVLETTLLTLAGMLGGLALASAAIAALNSYVYEFPTFGALRLDARIVIYTIFCSIAIVALCGCLPALRSSRGARGLSHGTRSQLALRQSLNWTLVGAQVALSVTLLVGAGLMLRSFDALARVDLGFEPERVLTFRISGSFGETNDPPAVFARIGRTLDELEAMPGVEAAGTSFALPGVSDRSQGEFEFVGFSPADGEPIVAEGRTVSPSYFATLGIPVLAGDVCRLPADPTNGPWQVMVNRAFADRYFPAGSAIGQALAGDSPRRVVGIVGSAREVGPHRDVPPTVYHCNAAPNPFPWFFVRTSGEPAAAIESVRARLAELEPLRSVYEFSPLETRISGLFAQNRLRAGVLTIFSIAALLLACVGIHGTLSYLVSQRRREIGLRLALGALQQSIVRHFVAKTLGIIAIASLAGIVLSLAAARIFSSLLYGTAGFDPLTFAAVAGLILVVSIVAALGPAMRASRVDPLVTLQHE